MRSMPSYFRLSRQPQSLNEVLQNIAIEIGDLVTIGKFMFLDGEIAVATKL